MHNKAFSIAKNPKYDRNKRGIASMFYKLFDKKTSGGAIKNESMSNKELAEDLHKAIIRNLKQRQVHLTFIDNIWGAYLADMTLINKFDKRICFLLCVIGISSKYVWVIILKEKKRYYNH